MEKKEEEDKEDGGEGRGDAPQTTPQHAGDGQDFAEHTSAGSHADAAGEDAEQTRCHTLPWVRLCLTRSRTSSLNVMPIQRVLTYIHVCK